MAHTNSTANYNLPQFLPTDKPTWLTDVNPAYASIDTAIKNVSDAAGAAQTDATQALSDAAGANAIATQANSKAEGAIASLSEQFLDTATYAVGEYVIFNNILYVCTEPVTTPGPWTGSVNWARASVDSIATSLNSDINNLENRTGSNIHVSDTVPTTIAQAINELSFSDTATLTYNSAPLVFTRNGNFIFISVAYGPATVQFPTDWVNIGTLPQNLRPVSNSVIFCSMTFPRGGTLQIRISTNGAVQILADSADSVYAQGSAIYII